MESDSSDVDDGASRGLAAARVARAAHTCDRIGRSSCAPCMQWQREMWDAINRYVVACGGDPSKHVYGNTPRMRAVVDVNSAVIRASNGDLIR